MGVGGQYIFIEDPVAVFFNPRPPLHTKDQFAFLAIPLRHSRVVEFMSLDFGTDIVIWVLSFNLDDGVAMSLGSFEKIECHRQDTDHGIGFVLQDQLLSQIHQPAALGIDRKAILGQCFELGIKVRIGSQLLGMGFGETAADIKPMQPGQLPVF